MGACCPLDRTNQTRISIQTLDGRLEVAVRCPAFREKPTGSFPSATSGCSTGRGWNGENEMLVRYLLIRSFSYLDIQSTPTHVQFRVESVYTFILKLMFNKGYFIVNNELALKDIFSPN